MRQGQVGILDGIELGIGNWAWGDRFFWAGGAEYSEVEARAAFDASMTAGIRLVDTAEMYGMGRAERLLGQFMRESGQRPLVATKFMPMPWRLAKVSLIRALRGSMKRLGVGQVDLYQIHWPVPPVPITVWMEAMVEAVRTGMTRAVGVSNFSVAQMQMARETLASYGVPLAANQVSYSLLDRSPEQNGVLAACQATGVRLIAYSPLAQGVLTGKYTPDTLPPGLRRWRYADLVRRVQPLIGLMREIGQDHDGKTVAQVALNWTICKGALPIPGARNSRQAEQNAGATGWRLTPAEIAVLDDASDRI